MIPGVDVVLADGKEYTFPPLSLGSLEHPQKELESFKGGAKSPATIIKVALHSLKRNYPHVTRADLAEIGRAHV